MAIAARYAIAEDAYQQIVSEERNQSSAYASSLVSLPPLPMYSLPQKPYLATSLCQSPLATACACTTHFTPQRRRSASLSPLCSCLLLALASPRLRREWRRQDRVCEDHDAVLAVVTSLVTRTRLQPGCRIQSLLEAFGNARTCATNSQTFGKFIEIQFNHDKMAGRICTYVARSPSWQFGSAITVFISFARA